jgi:hypothetical protein
LPERFKNWNERHYLLCTIAIRRKRIGPDQYLDLEKVAESSNRHFSAASQSLTGPLDTGMILIFLVNEAQDILGVVHTDTPGEEIRIDT